MQKAKIKGITILAVALLLPLLILLFWNEISSFDWAALGYAGVFVVMFITSATIILPLPTIAIATFVGTFTNPIIVGIVGGLGSALGEAVGYYAGYGGAEAAQLEARNHQYKQIKEKLSEKGHGFILIFVLALLPNPFFDFAGIAAGATKYPFWKFMLACALGKIIKVAVFAWLGSAAAGLL